MTTPECVIGAGAIGLSLAALLSQRAPVCVYAHPEQIDAIRANGVTMSGSLSISRTGKELTLATLPAELPTGGRYWICVKAFDVAAVAKTLSSQLTSGTTVLIANGLGMYSDLVEVLGRSKIVRALPSYGAHRLSLSHVRVSGRPRFDLAANSVDIAPRDQLQADLVSLGAEVTTISSIQTAEWRKILVATTVTTIASLANQPNGVILHNPELRSLAEDVLKELRAVATADGVDLSDLSDTRVFDNLQNHAGNINSLLAALRAALPTELAYTVLRPLLIARAHALRVPLLESIYRLLACIDSQHLLQGAHV